MSYNFLEFELKSVFSLRIILRRSNGLIAWALALKNRFPPLGG